MYKKLAILIILPFLLSASETFDSSMVDVKTTVEEKIDVSNELPWKRLTVKAGGFISSVNSSFGFRKQDGALQLTIDSEDQLKLEERNNGFRFLVEGRIKNRHTVDFDFFLLNRTAETFIGLDIPMQNDTINIGSSLFTDYKLMFSKLTYNFSIYQNDKIDLAIGTGVHLISTELTFSSETETYETIERLALPLPVLTAQLSYFPFKWWGISSNSSYLYIKTDSFEGSLTEASFSSDFRFLKHFGAGLGFSSIRVHGGAGLNKNLFADIDIDVNALFFTVSAYL
jgi:hypothetical protein